MTRLYIPAKNLGDDHVRNSRAIESWSLEADPVGAIVLYGGSADPLGWLICDGRAVSRQEYAQLFSVIGTSYGVGDGVTTFNIPNLQQRFPLGKATSGTGSTLGGTGGAIDHTHTGPSHTHTGPSHTHAPGTLAIPNHVQHTHTAGSYQTADHSGADNTSAGGVAHRTTSESHNIVGTSGDNSVSDQGKVHGTMTGAVAADGTGNTGAGGTGATGTQNPPFQVVNFIIRT